MPDVKISGLPPVTAPLDGSELIEVVKDGANARVQLRSLSTNKLVASTGTSYTVVLADQGAIIETNNSGGNTVTIPNDTTLVLPIGSTVIVRQIGSGVTTIVAGSGVTIQKKATRTLAIAEQYGQAVLQKRAANTWLVTGELTLL